MKGFSLLHRDQVLVIVMFYICHSFTCMESGGFQNCRTWVFLIIILADDCMCLWFFFYYVYADSFSFICLRFERCPTPIIVSFISCVSTVKKKKILNLINMMLCQSLFNIMLSIPTTPTVSKIRLIKTGSTARLIWVNWPLTHFLLLSSNQKYTITFFFLNAQVGWKKTRDMDSCYAFHTFLNRHEYSANTISKQEIINKKPEEEKF